MKVSILMLTYNAPFYVYRSIRDVATKTQNADYELVVVDNHSKFPTRFLLKRLENGGGKINTLFFNPKNAMFAGGNNLAATLASPESEYFLLLNSDIAIRDASWLARLLALIDGQEDIGIVSYGAVLSAPERADGYCLLIRSDLYRQYQLDEHFAWWWSVTKLQAQVLNAGYRILSVVDHENVLHHYGGKSGKIPAHTPGMETEMETVKAWFQKGHVEFLPHI